MASTGRLRANPIVLLALALASVACGDVEPTQPDLFLITVDSLRADQLACYGGPDALAVEICQRGESGTRFVWGFTTAPAGPAAAASLLTSLYPDDHGVDGAAGFLPSSVDTLAEQLHAGGYRTGAFVSSPELNHARNFHQGFDVFDDRLGRDAEGRPRRDATATTSAALEWLERTPAPRFTWVHYGDLHGPFPGTIRSYEEYGERYGQALAGIDAAVGRLLEAQARSGASLRPGVLIAGLHGEAAGEGGHWFRHGHSVGLEVIRIPMFWVPPGPDEPEPLVSSLPAGLVDALPTLVSAAGLELPEGLAGDALPGRDTPPRAPGLRGVFAAQPGRVAVVAGSTYYARDRELGSPARFRRLGAGGEPGPDLPARSSDALGPLEDHLRRFLHQSDIDAEAPAGGHPDSPRR